MCVSVCMWMSILPEVGAVSDGAIFTQEKSLPQF